MPTLKPQGDVVNTMKVKAAPGVRIPFQGAPRKYIPDDKWVDVPRNAYYIRRWKEKDLMRSDADPTPSTTSAEAAESAVATDTGTGTKVEADGVASEA